MRKLSALRKEQFHASKEPIREEGIAESEADRKARKLDIARGLVKAFAKEKEDGRQYELSKQELHANTDSLARGRLIEKLEHAK